MVLLSLSVSSRTAFITGVTGFVGSHLLVRLRENGWNVRALIHKTSLSDVDGIDLVHGSLENIDGFSKSLRGVDVVFHCAAALDPVPDEQSAELINHLGTVRLAEAAQAVGVTCFVYVNIIQQYFFRIRNEIGKSVGGDWFVSEVHGWSQRIVPKAA